MSVAIVQEKAERLQEQVRGLYAMMRRCRLCPRECGVDRLGGEIGVCRSGVRPAIASANLHHGEEPPISGTRGSGTVFFSGCNMACVFCQNFPISQLGVGNSLTVARLSDKMLLLQRRGAHNINFVTPTHFAAQMAHAVWLARRKGLHIPVVYNTSGFESMATLALLEGIVDIYLCDYRYVSPRLAKEYSKTEDYPKVVESAIGEMLRQTGPFDGTRGVIIRHLCLPGHLDETAAVLERIRTAFGRSVSVSFMTQYFPAYRAGRHPAINRRLTDREREKAWVLLRDTGLEEGWVQKKNDCSTDC